MIRRVTLRKFKRFEETTFVIPGNVVVAGPNNTGKTTLLQAIAAWSLVLNRWKELNNFHRRGGVYERAPIARQAFLSVPLRQFDLLWRDRRYDRHDPIGIEIATDEWSIPMELIPDSTEQIYVRPIGAVDPDTVRAASISPVFVPAMTGLSIDEPVFQPAKVDQLLALAKPGDVLRNLLLEAHGRGEVWHELSKCIRRLFHFELLPPDGRGANILAEYVAGTDGPRFDIASAGSGFQQVLMLLAFLYARPASVLLLDEPDAHTTGGRSSGWLAPSVPTRHRAKRPRFRATKRAVVPDRLPTLTTGRARMCARSCAATSTTSSPTRQSGSNRRPTSWIVIAPWRHS